MSDACQYLRKYRTPTTTFNPLWQPASQNVQHANPRYESIVFNVGLRRRQHSSSQALKFNRFPGLININQICFAVCLTLFYYYN